MKSSIAPASRGGWRVEAACGRRSRPWYRPRAATGCHAVGCTFGGVLGCCVLGHKHEEPSNMLEEFQLELSVLVSRSVGVDLGVDLSLLLLNEHPPGHGSKSLFRGELERRGPSHQSPERVWVALVLALVNEGWHSELNAGSGCMVCSAFLPTSNWQAAGSQPLIKGLHNWQTQLRWRQHLQRWLAHGPATQGVPAHHPS